MNEFEQFMFFGGLFLKIQMWIFTCGNCTWALALGPYAGGAGGATPRWCVLIYTLNRTELRIYNPPPTKLDMEI